MHFTRGSEWTYNLQENQKGLHSSTQEFDEQLFVRSNWLSTNYFSPHNGIITKLIGKDLVSTVDSLFI